MKAVLGFAITHAAWSYLLDAVGAEGIQNSGQGESSFTKAPRVPRGPQMGTALLCHLLRQHEGERLLGSFSAPPPWEIRPRGGVWTTGSLVSPASAPKGAATCNCPETDTQGSGAGNACAHPAQPCGEGEICPADGFEPGSGTSGPGAVHAGGAESLTAATWRQSLRPFGGGGGAVRASLGRRMEDGLKHAWAVPPADPTDTPFKAVAQGLMGEGLWPGLWTLISQAIGLFVSTSCGCPSAA